LSRGKPGNGVAASVFVVGGALAIFLTAGQDRFSGSMDSPGGIQSLSGIDTSTTAYQIGYSEIYLATGNQALRLRVDPKYNPYLTMPRSEWVGYAAARVSESDDGECDAYSAGTGDWPDYGAGANQALQDIASGYKPRMHLVRIDPDCD
jgi:hypothetical protein